MLWWRQFANVGDNSRLLQDTESLMQEGTLNSIFCSVAATAKVSSACSLLASGPHGVHPCGCSYTTGQAEALSLDDAVIARRPHMPVLSLLSTALLCFGPVFWARQY